MTRGRGLSGVSGVVLVRCIGLLGPASGPFAYFLNTEEGRSLNGVVVELMWAGGPCERSYGDARVSRPIGIAKVGSCIRMRKTTLTHHFLATGIIP